MAGSKNQTRPKTAYVRDEHPSKAYFPYFEFRPLFDEREVEFYRNRGRVVFFLDRDASHD